MNKKVAWIAVVVAALGYFVDVFDMFLFANLRVASLKSLNLSDSEITSVGATLFNYQQAGFLVGGFFWGILGDKFGRTSIMFGSIFVYSLATFLSGHVYDLDIYTLLRFISGFGLAGEIGAGITLVSEILPKETRGIGTTIVATLGVAGAAGAALVGKFFTDGDDWRIAFQLGGIMGFFLLLLRIITHESGLFSEMINSKVPAGSLKLLFSSGERIKRLLLVVAAGAPIMLFGGVVSMFSKEISTSMNIEVVSTPDLLIYYSTAMAIGDLAAGLLSQILRSRRKALVSFATIAFGFALYFGFFGVNSRQAYITLISTIGFFCGYWAVLLTTTSEVFGTNLRATITTSVPNLIRATVIPMNLVFIYLSHSMNFSALQAIAVLIVVVFTVVLTAIYYLPETFGKDLDFVEK